MRRRVQFPKLKLITITMAKTKKSKTIKAKYSKRIDQIRQLGGIKISPEAIATDERLRYLLEK
jgi:hypothetical protein